MPITSYDEAEQIWTAFNRNHENQLAILLADLQPKKIAVAKSKEPSIQAAWQRKENQFSEEEKKRREAAASIMQKRWRALKKTDGLFRVNPYGVHSNAFDNFIHVLRLMEDIKKAQSKKEKEKKEEVDKLLAPLQKNINTKKQEELLQALNNNDWATIFSGEPKPDFFNELQSALSQPSVLHVALGLFANDKINYHQMETIVLYREHQIPFFHPDYNHIYYSKYNFFPILTDEGDFSKEAKQFLLPNLNGMMCQKFDTNCQNRFKLLMQVIRAEKSSENSFMVKKIHWQEYEKDAFNKLIIKLKAVIVANNPDDHEEPYLIYLSSSALKALRITHFGLKNAIPSVTQIGLLDKKHIENGKLHGFRPKSGFFPGMRYNFYVHDYFTSYGASSSHDEHHPNIESMMGEEMRAALTRCKDIIRVLARKVEVEENKILFLRFVRPVWRLIDADLHYIFHHRISMLDADPQKIGEVFCLSTATANTGNQRDKNPIFLNEKDNGLNDSGITCAIDMARNTQIWQKMGVDPDYFIGLFKENFSFAKEIVIYFTNDPILNILLFRIFFNLQQHTECFPLLADCIKNIYQTKPERFVCKRDNQLMGFFGVVDKALNIKLEDAIEPTILSIINEINSAANQSIETIDMLADLANTLRAGQVSPSGSKK
jgi:hypothetical protein